MSALLQLTTLLHQEAEKAPPPKAVFYKTGVGDYAEHDKFIGVNVPTLRKLARQFHSLTLPELQTLLESAVNEERLLALLILVDQYKCGPEAAKAFIYKFYLENLKYVNNWNLVDASAHLIIGAHLYESDKNILITMAQSEDMWERRIAIVSTWYFIRNHSFSWTLKLSELLLSDKHDLIHKAVGWMLREVGKRDQLSLVEFLNQHASHMPRTMLRYAIERFPANERKAFMECRS